MTREHKLALIVGFSLVLVLGVLISDHFSKARQMQMAEDTRPATAREMGASAGAPIPSQPMGVPPAPTVAQGGTLRTDLVPLPGQVLPSQNPQLSLVIGPGDAGLPPGPGRAPTTPLVSTEAQVTPRATEPAAPAIPMQPYTVHEGDTLYRIAGKIYGEGKLWEKIKDFNKDKVGPGGELRDGIILQLPPKDVLLGKPYVPPDATKLQLASDPGAKPAPDTRPAKSEFKEYQVRDGDTLISIARKQLGAAKRWTEIADANKGTLSDPEALTSGMKLRIPSR